MNINVVDEFLKQGERQFIDNLYQARHLMTQLLLHTTLNQDTRLQKIGASFYFDLTLGTLYRLSFLPHGTVFYNQDVTQPPVASLTKYDPHFMAINKLSLKKLPINSLPLYFRQVDFSLIANQQEVQGVEVYTLNRQKIYNFLEHKVAKLHQCFEQHFENNYIKTEEKEKKYITHEIIIILKSEVDDHVLVEQFARERYNYSPLRRMMVQDQVQEPKLIGKPKSKSKKQTKKPPTLQPNQKTLSSFMNKPNPK